MILGLTLQLIFLWQENIQKKSQQYVEKAMHELKRGTLKSGRSNKKVTNPKQAVAIGLSEARSKGAKASEPN